MFCFREKHIPFLVVNSVKEKMYKKSRTHWLLPLLYSVY